MPAHSSDVGMATHNNIVVVVVAQHHNGASDYRVISNKTTVGVGERSICETAYAYNSSFCLTPTCCHHSNKRLAVITTHTHAHASALQNTTIERSIIDPSRTTWILLLSSVGKSSVGETILHPNILLKSACCASMTAFETSTQFPVKNALFNTLPSA